MRAHHYLHLQSYTHSPMFGIPETLPSSETLFFLSRALSVFLPCPATPNSKLCLSRPSQGLRFLSFCLICFVLSARTHEDIFSLFLSIPTRNRPHCSSIPLLALLTKTKQKRKKREFTSIAASDQTKKSRCICIIVHTIQYIYTITPFVVVVFSTTTTTTTKTCPSSSLP